MQLPTEPIEIEHELSAKEVPPEELLAKSSLQGQETLRYDPVAIEAQYSKKPLQVFGRVISIVWPFASFSIGIWWDRLRGKTLSQGRDRAIQLREILTKLGPAYITGRTSALNPTRFSALSFFRRVVSVARPIASVSQRSCFSIY